MSARRARRIALWSVSVAAAAWIVASAHYINDMSAFLPAKPTPIQKVLVDQLRDGPASRVLLIALEGGDAPRRAAVSRAMARSLRSDSEFSDVANGVPVTAARDREFLFQNRYLLSDAVDSTRFTAAGLEAAIAATIDDLASPAGLLLKSLVPHDPTGELLHIIDRLAARQAPRTEDGVWVSADGTRTLLVAQTAAAGSDTDAQERALAAVQRAFDGAVATAPGADSPGAGTVRLRPSGPGAFAVAARARIKNAATRLSLISSALVIGVLLTVYRSLPALALGLLPVASGALFGIAAVALGFGAVHGITLGFGVTLIGESVDYSIYFFIQSLRSRAGADPHGDWRRNLWPTIRLGMLTSVCGFASLLPSGFPGLSQLGLYSISGLIAAALVTRFVLPELTPTRFEIRDVTPLGRHMNRLRNAVRRCGAGVISGGAGLIAAAALALLAVHRDTLWNTELSALSPVPAADLRYDAMLRADLGAANVLDLVIVSGRSLEAVLQGAERAGATLQALVDADVIGGYDSPAIYLPSQATQQARRASLPSRPDLEGSLQLATAGLDLPPERLTPFLDDVAAARHASLLTARDLGGTSLAAGFGALLLRQGDRFSALLPLHAPSQRGTLEPTLDVTRVAAALAAAHLTDTLVLDLKAATDALYGSYLREATRLSLAGFVMIAVLLSIALRSAARVLRVLLPLVLAVLCVAAALVLCGERLTIMHLVGMLLIVAIGSNYALFFDQEGSAAHAAPPSLTLASLAIANLSTVIGFGLLSFSRVPVLVALGTTVGPGAFMALVFSAIMTSRQPVQRDA